MAAKMKARRKRSYGGRTDKSVENKYNAVGSPESKEAEKDKDDGFKRGGIARKSGGHVGGESEKPRMDKRARGMKRATGGSVFSAAHKLGSPVSKHGAGHEGESVKEEP